MENITRRKFIGTSALATAAFAIPNINFGKPYDMQGKTLGSGTHQYKVVDNWGQLGAAAPVKDCHEMVQDKKGRLILLTNETKNNVIIYDKSGKLITTWGHDWPGAHGLTLSNEGGEEFLYITDHDRHEVYKTTLDGKVLLTLGFPKENPEYCRPREYKPTETAIGPNGDIYIADGYGLSFVNQYTQKGEFVRAFGGNGGTASNLTQAHGICLDTRDKQNPKLIVTDRAVNELKWFTLDGQLIKVVKIASAFICRPVINGENIYCAALVSKSFANSRSGHVVILDKNDQVISAPGATKPEYKDGKLLDMKHTWDGFMHPHDVCVDDELSLYVPQWNSDRTYPVKLQRI
jgi:peptidylamidoglycolate lyase